MSQISRVKEAEITNGNIINADDISAELVSLITESNAQDTRIGTLETGNYTQSGTVTFSNAPKTNQIDERTAASGVTIDSVLCKDGSIRIPGSSGYTPAADGDLGYDTAKDLFLTYDGAVKPVALNSGVNAQTGTTYTVLTTDRNKLVTLSNASSVAVTLPQAGSTGFANNFVTTFVSLGAGTVTITPTTSTIDGGSSITLTQNQGVEVFSDGTNYFTNRGRGSSPGLVLISSATASSSASISFTSGIDSTYDHYIVEIIDAVPATDNVTMNCTLSTNGGSSYLASTNYEYVGRWVSADDTELMSSNAGTSTFPLNGTTAGNTFDNGSDQSINITFHLFAPASAKKHKVRWEGSWKNNAYNKTTHGYASGTSVDTSAVNAIKFEMSSGNIASGGFRLYGVRKS